MHHSRRVAVVLTLACLCATTVRANPNPTRVGVILLLSGPGTYYGQQMQRGMQECRTESEELFFEDSQTKPAVGVSAFQSLVIQKKIDIAVTAFSTISKAIIPVAQQQRVPVFVTIASSSAITRTAGENVSKYFTYDEQESPLLADYAFRILGARTAGILHQEDEFGVSYSDVFQREFSARGGRITSRQSFSREEADFRSSILKVRSTNPDVALAIGLNGHIGNILEQGRQMKVPFPWLTNWSGPDFTEFSQRPELYEGLRLLAPGFYLATSPNAASFKERYNRSYGSEPEAYAAIGCDIVGLINAASRAESLISALRGMRDYSGVMGTLSANSFGEITFPVRYAIVTGGKVVEVSYTAR